MTPDPEDIFGHSGLILASASKSRARLLLGAGLSFTTDPADIDEDLVKISYRESGRKAYEAALQLAEDKALKVSAKEPDAIVIGADQILHCDGEWFDKPVDRDGLIKQLTTLRGRVHQLVCAVTVAHQGKILWRHYDSTRMTMREFSPAFLDTYVENVGDMVTGSVGGYHLEGYGVHLFEKIEGDYFTILGLPLLPLLGFLRSQGIVET